MTALDAAPAGTREPRILVLGYGNPGRQDDGLGPAAAASISRLECSNITAFDNYQLTIEDAMEVAAHDVVWFIDAARSGPGPFAVLDVAPSPQIEFTSHILRPEAVLAIAHQCFGKLPQAFLLAIRGYEFEFVEALTPEAADNLDVAVTMLTERVRAAMAASKGAP
jgi:hydrogenase maturation protease